MENLTGKRVAILATDGFEQSELFVPKEALEKAGANVEIVSMKGTDIKGWSHKNWGKSIAVDKQLSEASSSDYDALVLPGGVMNPDILRRENAAVRFVTDFISSSKPVAAICHAPQLLIETKLLNGIQMTSYPSIKTDLINAGAKWIDKEVVVDKGIITSRSPSDLPAFCKKMIEVIFQGKNYSSRDESSSAIQ